MKKAFLLFILLSFIITGCSEVENEVKNAVTTELGIHKLVEQIGQAVDTRNAFETKFEKSPQLEQYNQAIEHVEKILGQGKEDTQALKDAISKGDSLKDSMEKGKATTLEVEKKIKDLQALLVKISGEQKPLAKKALDDLAKLTADELKVFELYIKRLELEKKYYEAIEKGKEADPEELNKLVEEQLTPLEKQVDQQIEKFNQSWNTLHKKVIGKDTLDPPK